jgi:hypothetical protein
MINLVRSLKKRRINLFDKQDIDVEQQERELNPFGHLAQKESSSFSALKSIITPKKRRAASAKKTPMSRSVTGTPATINGFLSPSNNVGTPIKHNIFQSNTEYDNKLPGWKDLETLPTFTPSSHNHNSNSNSVNTKRFDKENMQGFGSPVTPANYAKKSIISSVLSKQAAKKVPTPMSDESDKLETYHSPIHSPLQTLHSSPNLQSRVASPKTTPRNFTLISIQDQHNLASPKTPMSNRRMGTSPTPRRLVFDETVSSPSNTNRMTNESDFRELATEEDEYDFMSNEEKIASVFCMVKSPFEKSRRGVSSPQATPSRKRIAVSSPVAPSHRNQEQYTYSLRIFIGSARDLIDTQVGFKRNPDPYVTLEVGQCRQNTHYIQGTRNPCFNQSFSFIVHSTRRPYILDQNLSKEDRYAYNAFENHNHKDPDLVIKVFDHDNIFSHAFMGKCVISLTELLEQCQQSQSGRSEVKTAELKLSGEGINQGILQIVYDMSHGCTFKF